MITLSFPSAGRPIPPKVRTEKQKEIIVNGMIFQWQFDEHFVHVKLSAPTTGWIAIGFNTQNELQGTNLVMGAIEHDFVNIEDRFILKPGLHKSILELGGSDALIHRGGVEQNGISTIWFSMPLSVNDKFHHDLLDGKVYWVLLAYSQENDFQHHSIMRTSIKIKL